MGKKRLKCLWNEILSNIFWLHWEGQLKWLYNFFGRIYVTPFLVQISNFIGYANNTTTDVILYNEYIY